MGNQVGARNALGALGGSAIPAVMSSLGHGFLVVDLIAGVIKRRQSELILNLEK
jgi:hypothetical protein